MYTLYVQRCGSFKATVHLGLLTDNEYGHSKLFKALQILACLDF